jgi:hypothetical protein
MPPMAIQIPITFYTTRWSYLRYGCCEEFYQRLCDDITMITDILLLMDTVQDSGPAIADHAAALNGKYNHPRMF